MSRRVYHPNHTAHIRRRLTRMAVTGLIGLAGAAAAAGVLAVVGSRAGDSSGGLVTAAWGRQRCVPLSRSCTCW